MENQTQIQSRNTNLCLVIIFWIYTIIHFIVIVYYFIVAVDFTSINRANIRIISILSSLFISFLLTAIFVTVNYYRNFCMSICLILSLISELIFISLLIFLIYAINHTPGRGHELAVLLVVFHFLIESCPNILLYVHICRKLRNKNSENLDNINKNSPLLNVT